MPTTDTLVTEADIWGRLLQPADQVLSVEAAQSILRLEFPQEDKDRMRVLAAKARDGTLSKAEQEEIRNYEQVGNLLGVLHSKARQRLKKDVNSNGPTR